MSSYENRFRLFSSVEVEGQLYMTPRNFLESINLTEPKEPRAGFKIAFNMLDKDGNQMVDKMEFLVLEEIFRKKKDKKEEDTQRSDQKVLKKDSQHADKKGMWDVVKRGTSQVLFSDLSEQVFRTKIKPGRLRP
ncbi:hypothetical protein NHX12_011769, partial [Muraenolepis orangiensis]